MVADQEHRWVVNQRQFDDFVKAGVRAEDMVVVQPIPVWADPPQDPAEYWSRRLVKELR